MESINPWARELGGIPPERTFFFFFKEEFTQKLDHRALCYPSEIVYETDPSVCDLLKSISEDQEKRSVFLLSASIARKAFVKANSCIFKDLHQGENMINAQAVMS